MEMLPVLAGTVAKNRIRFNKHKRPALSLNSTFNMHRSRNRKRVPLLLFIGIALHVADICNAFTSLPINQCITGAMERRREQQLRAVPIEGYSEAFQIIDGCAVSGQPSEQLYESVRFIDKNSYQIYPDLDHKRELWDKAHGSWKLQLATGGGKFKTFKPIPIFAFAVIDENNFGNGVGINQDIILLSLLGPHYFNEKIRQMVITIDDMYLGGNAVTSMLPGFVRNAIGLGKKPNDFVKRPPAFTMIGASDKALIARGGSGGIAIWTRLNQDIRAAAYKMD
jgi:hypothetical protein